MECLPSSGPDCKQNLTATLVATISRAVAGRSVKGIILLKWLRKRREKNRRKSADSKLEALSSFFPNSDNYWEYPELAYSAANKFPLQLKMLLPEECNITHYADFDADSVLADLFNKYGSDKSRHGYVPIYSHIIKKIGKDKVHLLEIGLGTNNPTLISSMGSHGKPGASLRAFRDYLPTGMIFGADIDREILFEEERIKTAWVDQTELSTFQQLVSKLENQQFNLVIDDGLHSTEANLNTLLFWRDTAPVGGWIVIEDIPERTIDAWKTVIFILEATDHKATLCKTVFGYVLMAEKIA